MVAIEQIYLYTPETVEMVHYVKRDESFQD